MGQLQLVSQIFSVTGPVFAMVFLGLVLRKARIIDTSFIQTASQLVFKGSMPTLFFLSIWRADLNVALQPELLVFATVGTLIAFAASWWWAIRHLPSIERGVFVQGSFRGNCGVVSLALAAAWFGDYGLSVGGVLAGFTILLFNTLSVFILAFYSPHFQFSALNLVKELARNPLILSVVLGLFASGFDLHVPAWVEKSAQYFASLTLPLALICIGGTLSQRTLKQSGAAASQSTFIKVFFAPVLGCSIASLFGVTGDNLIILWMYLASPTAAASFAMALAAGTDGRLAASIIAVSTLVSIVTISAGIYFLKWLGN